MAKNLKVVFRLLHLTGQCNKKYIIVNMDSERPRTTFGMSS